MSKYLNYRAFWFILIILIGCVSKTSLNLSDSQASRLTTESGMESNKDYILQIGDALEIIFFYNPELNQTVMIRPDGKISLHLVGELLAAELPPSELNEVIIEKYREILKRPGVTVNVKKFEERKVYVGGEVMIPAMIPFNRGVTALGAILSVGGFKETASKKSVIIISKGPVSLPIARSVDLGKVISGKAPEGDILLQPFDIVYVPKTFIAEVNKVVEQYITKLIPGQLSAGFSYAIVKDRDRIP